MTHPFEQNSFKDYRWTEGKPVGISPLSLGEAEQAPLVYKVLSDPYHKHFSIERYEKGRFHSVVYDSKFLDFRYLEPREQQGWQKQLLEETELRTFSLIRNIDDRIILLETCFFTKGFCRECLTTSPHSFLLSVQKISYRQFGDAFDGVTLYDANEHPVMVKKYLCDAAGLFTDLIEENWNVD